MSPRIELAGDDAQPRVLLLARGVPFPGSLSGAQRRVGAFLEEFEQRGIPTLAYVADGDGSSVPSSRTSLVRTAVPAWARGARRDLASLREAKRWAAATLDDIRAFAPTVVLERARYLDDSGARIARALDVPHVLELHGLLADDARGYYASPLAPLGRRIEAHRYRRADATIVVSEGLRRWLTAAGVPPERVHVVPNGAERAERVGIGEIEAVRNAWGITSGAVVGWIGHLMVWQAPSFARLARAVAAATAQAGEATLVVVAPADAGTLAVHERLAGGSTPVRFVGPAAARDAARAVAAFDVGVIPTARTYDLPVKLFQYGAAGIPTVAPAAASITALDGSDELYLFEPDDDDAFAAALASALTDPEAGARADRFRAVVERRYLWSNTVDATLALLRHAQP